MHDARETATALGGAVRAGAGWLARCPVPTHGRGRGDIHPSLSLLDSDGARLLLRCHAGCDQQSVPDALHSRGLWGGPAAGSEHRVHEHPVSDRVPDPDKLAYARALWRKSLPAARSPVETYLRSRGIALAPPPTLRFHASLKHTESSRCWPAMVAAVQGPDGRVIGLHRTFLHPDGSAKAPLSPAKKMLGACAGGAVRLAAVGECLQITEGIETALAVLQATEQPTWAAMSAPGLAALILPAPVQRVVICADGDDPGEAAARAAAARWTTEGRAVRIARPPWGCDFLDVLAGTVAAIVSAAA